MCLGVSVTKRRNTYPGVYSYQTKTQGRRWACVYDAPPVGGQRAQKRRSGFATQDEALAFQRDRARERRLGAADLQPSDDLLGVYADAWLADQVDLAPGTQRNYRNRLRPILERIGHIPLNRLTPADIERTYAAMRRGGLSPAAIRYGHRILKQALRRAVLHGMLAANPCERVTTPRSEPHRPATWTQDELRRFLAAEGDDPAWGDVWHVLAETWLRIGELADLRWGDIDWDQRAIRITHAVSRDAAFQYVSGPVKTPRSRRVIPISRRLLDRLAARRAALDAPPASALIFQSPRRNAWITSQVANKALRRACERAGVPVIGIHEVRHSGGSIAYRAGLPLKVISERLGHADVTFTHRIYVHTHADDHRELGESIAALLTPDVTES